jgi:hypothetical protein
MCFDMLTERDGHGRCFPFVSCFALETLLASKRLPRGILQQLQPFIVTLLYNHLLILPPPTLYISRPVHPLPVVKQKRFTRMAPKCEPLCHFGDRHVLLAPRRAHYSS